MLISAAPTVGFAKDVVVTGTLALVAVSSLGVQAFDISAPEAPKLVTTIFTWGSTTTMALMGDGTRLAVANWDDVTILDVSAPQNLRVLAVDRVLSATHKDPRVLGVAAFNDIVVGGDWLGLGTLRWHEDRVGPEFDLDRLHLTLGNVAVGESAQAQFEVLNRGFLTLEVTAASSDDPSGAVGPTTASIEPGASKTFTATYTAPVPDGQGMAASLRFDTNDPNESSVFMALRGNVSGSRLGVGDPLTSTFDFLDVDSPPGAQDVAQLQGNVLVLAYFATF